MNQLLALFFIYASIVYIFLFICLIIDYDEISDEKWATPFKSFYFAFLNYIFSPLTLPFSLIKKLIKSFLNKSYTAKINLYNKKVREVCKLYNRTNYNHNEKVSEYIHRNKHSTNPDIKLFREYLHKEKIDYSILDDEDIYIFHKNGWY